jgi:hypothetical protein
VVDSCVTRGLTKEQPCPPSILHRSNSTTPFGDDVEYMNSWANCANTMNDTLVSNSMIARPTVAKILKTQMLENKQRVKQNIKMRIPKKQLLTLGWMLPYLPKGSTSDPNYSRSTCRVQFIRPRSSGRAVRLLYSSSARPVGGRKEEVYDPSRGNWEGIQRGNIDEA